MLTDSQYKPGLSQWLSGQESACSAGDSGHAVSIPGLGRSSGRRHDNPLQHSCPENLTDRGDWWAAVHGVAESDTTETSKQAQA